MRLQWAQRCISAGNPEEASKQFKFVDEHPELLNDEGFRIDYAFQRAALAARQGDSKNAVEIYSALIKDEAKNLNVSQFNTIQQLLQFQRQAAEQWEDELKYREEDAKKTNPHLVLETEAGKIVIELFEDDAPNTVASLVNLAQKKFYDGLTFHRFVQDFMIQGGDPNGDGTGGPGYRLKSEISRRNHFRGTVAMARSNHPDSQGSQFYICVSNSPDVINLSGKYVVVGRVIDGMEIVDRLRVGAKMKTVRAENLREHEYKPETLKE
ncbi:MAG: peptidylprolyl isomerase [Planctomycetes bacterium]|nr:peptidylprolyl isomerase [Planctomycetota bacterium]